jgi:hypothetical protein
LECEEQMKVEEEVGFRTTLIRLKVDLRRAWLVVGEFSQIGGRSRQSCTVGGEVVVDCKVKVR